MEISETNSNDLVEIFTHGYIGFNDYTHDEIVDIFNTTEFSSPEVLSKCVNYNVDLVIRELLIWLI